MNCYVLLLTVSLYAPMTMKSRQAEMKADILENTVIG